MFASQMGRGAWVYGMNGASKLDYMVIKEVLFDHFGIKKKHRKQLMSDLMAMEIPALNAMHEK